MTVHAYSTAFICETTHRSVSLTVNTSLFLYLQNSIYCSLLFPTVPLFLSPHILVSHSIFSFCHMLTRCLSPSMPSMCLLQSFWNALTLFYPCSSHNHQHFSSVSSSIQLARQPFEKTALIHLLTLMLHTTLQSTDIAPTHSIWSSLTRSVPLVSPMGLCPCPSPLKAQHLPEPGP